jgi:hypothetical protein
MRLRRRWKLAGLAGLLALPWLLWGGYAAVGVLRGQHLYHGLPSGYWASAVRRHEHHDDWLTAGPVWLREALGLGGIPAVLAGDPAAVPVLLDLLRSKDENVSVHAELALRATRPEARIIMPVVIRALHESDKGRAVRAYLVCWEAPDAARLLAGAICELPAEGRAWAFQLLMMSRGKAQSAVPVLLEIACNGPGHIRSAAAEAVHWIDPEAAEQACVWKPAPGQHSP